MGFVGAAYGGETSATMEKAKGETKALVEEGKGQTKGAVEGVKGKQDERRELVPVNFGRNGPLRLRILLRN